jgi:poly(hydroxyalkanoate) depolymerase family esterase
MHQHAQRLISAWRPTRLLERTGSGQSLERVFKARPYLGSRDRQYVLRLPRGYTGRRAVPLVMLLHGCNQRHTDIREITGFDDLADREGSAVVYPFVTSYPDVRLENCWGWWQANEIRPGCGEVQDLWEIVEEIRTEYHIDPRRIHVTGLSSGAGMTVAMLIAHAGKIASGATVAGVPYSETPHAIKASSNSRPRLRPMRRVVMAMNNAMRHDKRAVPLFIVHGFDDPVVDIEAATNLRDSWAMCFGIDPRAAVRTRDGRSGDLAWTHQRHRGVDRRPLVETLFVHGGGHGWFGGNPGPFSYPEGPDISTRMWRFFRDNPLNRRRPIRLIDPITMLTRLRRRPATESA